MNTDPSLGANDQIFVQTLACQDASTRSTSSQISSTAQDFASIFLPLLVSVLISPEMFNSLISNVFFISLS